MISCECFQQKLAEDGLSPFLDPTNTELVDHASSCSQCRALLREWSEVEEVFKHRQRPDPGEPFWDKVWTDFSVNLPAHLRYKEKKEPWFRKLTTPLVWQPLFGAMLVLIGFFAGRMIPKEEASILSSEIARHPEEQLVRRVEAHLEQSKLLLLGFVNISPQSAVSNQFDFSREKELSGQLIEQSSFLQDAMLVKGHQPLQELFLELEIILLQISNLASDYNSFDLELVKDAIDQGAVLYKINLQEMTGTPKLMAKESDRGRSI